MVDVGLLQSLSYVAAAIGVCAAAVYYMMTLRVQQANMKATLQTREAQLFNSLYQRYGTSEYCKQYITCMTMSWQSYDDWRRRYPDEGYEVQQFYSLTNWYKTMNLLVEQGYVSSYAMGRLIALEFFAFYAKFKPIVEEMRRVTGSNIMLDLDRLHETLLSVNRDVVIDHGMFQKYFEEGKDRS